MQRCCERPDRGSSEGPSLDSKCPGPGLPCEQRRTGEDRQSKEASQTICNVAMNFVQVALPEPCRKRCCSVPATQSSSSFYNQRVNQDPGLHDGRPACSGSEPCRKRCCSVPATQSSSSFYNQRVNQDPGLHDGRPACSGSEREFEACSGHSNRNALRLYQWW